MDNMRIGVRIRLNTKNDSGWRGTGTVYAISGNCIEFVKDGVPDAAPGNVGFCRRDQADIVAPLIAGDRVKVRKPNGKSISGIMLADSLNGVIFFRADEDPQNVFRSAARSDAKRVKEN